MKSAKILFLTASFMFFTSAFAQQTNRSDICRSIPGLNTQQQQKIDKLSISHQQNMDALRIKYQSETNSQTASNLKAQMKKEMLSHYQNISALLTADQKTWYDQQCQANSGGNYYSRQGYGRNNCVYGRGLGRGQGIGRGQGSGRSQAIGRGQGAGRNQGVGRGGGRGGGRV